MRWLAAWALTRPSQGCTSQANALVPQPLPNTVTGPTSLAPPTTSLRYAGLGLCVVRQHEKAAQRGQTSVQIAVVLLAFMMALEQLSAPLLSPATPGRLQGQLLSGALQSRCSRDRSEERGDAALSQTPPPIGPPALRSPPAAGHHGSTQHHQFIGDRQAGADRPGSNGTALHRGSSSKRGGHAREGVLRHPPPGALAWGAPAWIPPAAR